MPIDAVNFVENSGVSNVPANKANSDYTYCNYTYSVFCKFKDSYIKSWRTYF